MKLLTKATIYFSTTAFIVMLISGSIVYVMLQRMIHEEVDERLIEQKNKVAQELQRLNDFDRFDIPMDSSIRISPPMQAKQDMQTALADTFKFSELEGEAEPYRMIRFPVTLKEETRLVTILQSLINPDELIEAISISFFTVLVIMILALIAVNFIAMRRIWLPFRQILSHIKSFDFHQREPFAKVSTDIMEFNELNHELTKMAKKLSVDYNSLKEFSENASHEMQTPLAIISSKLEILLQHKDLNQDTMKVLVSAHKATGRLSRLHHDLNLLSRIQNNEFTDKHPVRLKTLIEDQIENFSDLIAMKDVQLDTEIRGDPVVEGNPYLLEIMLSNLFGNAIKHNIPTGRIQVSLSDIMFSIANTGPEPRYPPERMFERFQKGISSSYSTGLGLAIVKQICVLHQHNIEYTYNDGRHLFDLRF